MPITRTTEEQIRRWLSGIVLLVAAVGGTPAKGAGDIVETARSYVATGMATAPVEKEIRAYSGPIDAIIDQLRPTPAANRPAGVFTNEHFLDDALRRSHPEELLNYLVPETAAGDVPAGLLIFMHGGGNTTPREAAAAFVAAGANGRSAGLRPAIDEAPFITVAPSALWNEKVSARWNLPETEQYLSDIIEESVRRFGIDRDRVFLGGHSMGGFGAYHFGQRMSDRIAGALLCSGSWATSRWDALAGTPVFIIHGKNDAVPAGAAGTAARPRFTDVFYARSAHELLERAKVPHVYEEHAGHHALAEAQPQLARFLGWSKDQRRDPFAKRVVLADPRGTRGEMAPSPHCRWVSVLERMPGEIEYDTVVRTGPPPAFRESAENFHAQGFRVERKRLPGAVVEASLSGNNIVMVKTANVKRLALWLHPRMVDFSRPITIVLNGRITSHDVVPTLWDALRSYQRRQDWGLIYHAELVLEVQ